MDTLLQYVLPIATAVAPGLYLIWRAFVAAAVRRIDQAYRDNPDAHDEHVTEQVCSKSPLPRGVIAAQVAKRSSTRPPKAG